MHGMQLAEIENERRRHLKNWLIESTPHMAKNSQHQGGQNRKNDKVFNTSVFNDSFLLSRKSYAASSDQLNVYSHPVSANTSPEKPSLQQRTKLSFSNTPTRTSHSISDDFAPSLRRFMAQDISLNTFSVTEFELARQTRKFKKERAKRKDKAQHSEDSSTGGSKRSSEETNTEPLAASVFLDRFRLPQIARISEPIAEPQTLENKTTKQSSLKSFFRKLPKTSQQAELFETIPNEANVGSELFLLYRLCRRYKFFHAVNKRKNVKIPQDFGGYFSLVENGTSTAIAYSTITQLIRDKVFKFVSLNKLQGYTESGAKDLISKKSHYSKTSVKPGEVLSLLAVFEEQKFEDSIDSNFEKSQKDKFINSGREKKKGRYVQLMMEDRKIIYVPISTKGKFFEIDTDDSHRTKKINPDCIYKISNLIDENTSFPLTIRLVVNTSTARLDYLTVVRVSTEDFVIGCPFIGGTSPKAGAEFYKNAHLEKIPLTSGMKFAKTTLGFGSHNEMFENLHIKYLVQFCERYCDSFVSIAEIEKQEKIGAAASVEDLSGVRKEKQKLKVLSKLLSTDKHSPAAEIEDSIIFISKSELEKMDLKKKYLTPEIPSSSDDHIVSDTRPNNMELTNQYMNASGGSLSEVSVDSSSRAFCKFFSMQSLDFNTFDKNDEISAELYDRWSGVKESTFCSTSNLKLANQKSFVTEKLFNEFHHSTKQQSKSSFLLNQLLNFKAKKVTVKETQQTPKHQGESALMHLNLPSPPEDLDLPYYLVHDAIQGEDVYTEICAAMPNAS